MRSSSSQTRTGTKPSRRTMVVRASADGIIRTIHQDLMGRKRSAVEVAKEYLQSLK